MQDSFDVVIIGRGLTGLSTAWHLKRLGIQRICLVGTRRTPNSTASLNAGYASVTLNDNITRTAHGLGDDVAHEILRLNRIGFSELTNLLDLFEVSCRFGNVYRISGSPSEDREISMATDWLQKNGFPASFGKMGEHNLQRDGAAAASLNIGSLLNRIEKDCDYQVFDLEIEKIISNQAGLTLIGVDGTKLSSEIAVLSCHIGIKTLIPELKSALINFADQMIEFDIKGNKEGLLEPGNLLFSNHSQFWISSSFKNTVYAGGARFLRKWAGVEADIAPVLESVTLKLKEKIENLSKVKVTGIRQSRGILDMRACDEIPLIGPMYGDSRILIAGGYMGSGLTLGCAAGKGIAEIIFGGRSETVPHIFHPKRLRSLPDND